MSSPDLPWDPAALEIFKNLYASVAEEMGITLGRTAYSVNIKERRDYSCAVFDAQGRLIAQAAHIPVRLPFAKLANENSEKPTLYHVRPNGCNQ